MKKRLLFLLVLISLMLVLSLTSYAMEGSGTESDPYLVKTADDFVAIKNNLSAYYRLEADISVSSTSGAIVEGVFKGVFDGNGKTVELYIDAPTDKSGDTLDALFGLVTGTVKNVTVTGSVKGSNKTAGIVGKLYGSGVIENCVNYASVYGRKNVAGIAGVAFENARVINCINYGEISGKAISNGVDLGGIVGCIWNSSSSKSYIIGCVNLGTLNGDGTNVGGICGLIQSGKINNCINIGTPTAKQNAGVIIGGADNPSQVTVDGYFSTVDGKISGSNQDKITIKNALLESAGVAIYLGSGSGIRGEFYVIKDMVEALAKALPSCDIEYGTVVSTKDAVAELKGDLISEEAKSNGKVAFAPAMKDGEIQYSFVNESKSEGFHSYRFALTNFPDSKQSYNMEFVILGYLKITDKDGNAYVEYVNTVKSMDLASNVEGTDLNAVNILRVAEVTLRDGDFNSNQDALDVLNHIVSLKSYDKQINIDGVTSYGHANAAFTSHISSDDTVVFEINNTYDDELSSYISDLEANGYLKTLENVINGNCFYTYLKGDKLIHISYFPKSNEVNISSETLSALPENIAKPSYEKKNDSSITQIKLADNVSIKEGMSYVIHLADGTFFIIDGGWCYDDYLEADKLYEVLADLAGSNDIVIAGWLFTHCHGDHIGTFNYFVEKYHANVTIKELIYNFPSDDDIRASASSYMLNDTKQRYNYFREVISTYLTDTEIVKVHSGYKFYYANMEVEILQTFEDLYPGTVANYDFNSSSTIFTVKLEGQKMLFVGDVSDTGASLLNKNFGSALKSDFVQVAHHGLNSSGTIKQMYVNANASYVLYPAPNDWYRGNINNDANAYLQSTDSIKQIFVSGIDTFKINLPYDGSIYDGAKVPAPGVKTEIERPETVVDVPDAYFDLDLTGGVIKDSQGNATLNVVNGAVKETTVLHNGKELTGLAYTSGNNGTYYINLNLNDITTEAQMKDFVMGSTTFEIFLKLDKLPGATVGLITSCNGGGVTLYLRKQAGGQINFQMGSTSPNGNTDGGRKYSAAVDMNGSGPVISAGELLHIVGSYDSKTNMMKLYLNGMLLAQADFGNGNYSLGSQNDTVIGIGNNPQYNGECLSSYANYELYEAKIYNVALTDEQVAQEYWNCIDNLFTEAENE